MKQPMPVDVRFWSKVDRSGECWRWTAKITRDGYGCFTVKRNGKTKFYGAHRFAYELTSGPIPAGMQVDHRCFNRWCVRPEHLRLASNRQNAQNRQGAQANSKTGVRGVWKCHNGSYIARVRHKGVYHFVGLYPTIKEAEAAVVEKRNELFTHNDRDRVA